MLKNYLKIAYRNLMNKRGFAIINILGLSIGMTCCLLIFQFISFEYSFDSFHKNEKHIYRVLQAYAKKGEELTLGHAYTAQALAPALKASVPEISQITRVHAEDAVVSNPARPTEAFEDDKILYVDRAFLSIFTFPLVNGDTMKALLPGTCVISEAAAMKYFKTPNPQGQVLEVAGIENKSYSVSAVIKDVPANSHLQFDVLLPMRDLLSGQNYSGEPEGGWSWNNFSTYVQLHPGADLNTAKKKMTDVYLRKRGEIIKQQGAFAAMNVQPLRDIHLNSEVGGPDIVSGSYKTVKFFLMIGAITLIIALVNYVNLATSRAVNRSREVGVRKVVGANKGQLIIQFLSESALTNFIAAVLAVMLATALIPTVNDLAEIQLSPTLWLNPGFWTAFVSTVATGALLAGIYPAFVLSSFKPASVLKGKSGYFAAHLWLRRALVVVQFTASISLVAGTVIVFNQLMYMRNLDLGLDLHHVLSVRAPRLLASEEDRATASGSFVQEVKRIPGVEAAAISSSIPGSGFNWNGAAIRKRTDDPSMAISGVATYIDTAFAELYDLKLVAGQEFKDITISEDENAPWTVMLNETAVKSLGFNSSAEAVGQALNIGGYDAEVVGVYRDFNWSSAHQARQSIVFGPTTTGSYFSFKINTRDYSEAIERIGKVYEALFPGNVYSYNFVDESFDRQYTNDTRFARLFSIAAGMTIFIACLGLFGLVAFTTQQRTKEIGMRKVLGASVSSVVMLLSKDFIKLVAVGFALAIPLTFYFMNKWLENFAYKTSIEVWMLLLAGITAMAVALLTVSWHSFKAASANPVNSLRTE